MPAKIALVSCVKTKHHSVSTAEGMYISPLFQSMRWYAQRHADAWFILSAEYGLLHPGELIQPYEKTLNIMPKMERLAWAERVKVQLLELLPQNASVTLLAGKRYREHLIPFLEANQFTVSVPMFGLSFGRQLSWLNEQKHHANCAN